MGVIALLLGYLNQHNCSVVANSVPSLLHRLEREPTVDCAMRVPTKSDRM